MVDNIPSNTEKYPCPTTHDFDPAPLATKGNINSDHIYSSVGRSLSAWALVEYNIARIYAAILQSRSLAADRSISALMSFGGRLDVVRAAMTVTLTEPGDQSDMRDTIESFLRTSQKASARRNEIAHGHAVSVRSTQQTVWFLMPQHICPSKYEMPGGGEKYRFNATMIMTFANRFTDLAHHLGELGVRIQRLLPSWQETPRAPDSQQPQAEDSESPRQE